MSVSVTVCVSECRESVTVFQFQPVCRPVSATVTIDGEFFFIVIVIDVRAQVRLVLN